MDFDSPSRVRQAAWGEGNYIVEYAKSGRSACKGKKPCTGTKILAGDLRFGVAVMYENGESFAFRHWGCVSLAQFNNVRKRYASARDIPGYNELRKVDQIRVSTAFANGAVDPEDVPLSARTGKASALSVTLDEKALRERGETVSPMKPVYYQEGYSEETPRKPFKKEKKKPAPKKKAKKSKYESEEDDGSEESAISSDEEKPSHYQKSAAPVKEEYIDAPRRSSRVVKKRTETLFADFDSEEEEDVKPVLKKQKKVKAEPADDIYV